MRCCRFVWAFQFLVLVGLPLTLAMNKVCTLYLVFGPMMVALLCHRLLRLPAGLGRCSQGTMVCTCMLTLIGIALFCAQLYETRLLWVALLAVEGLLTILGSNAFM